MTDSPAIRAFWEAWASTLPEDRRPAACTAWSFGDSPALADELASLVCVGIKRATCSLLWELEADGEPLPQSGQYSVILDASDLPLCIIETTEVAIRPYDEVDAAFAFDEGEGDRSLESWREGHWRYFTRVCRRLAREPVPDMPLICERFRVVYAP